MFHTSTVLGISGLGAIAGFGLLIALLILWSFVWKGLALWRAARLGHTGWFVALLIINTAGILEILYLYVFSKPIHGIHPRPEASRVGGWLKAKALCLDG